MKLKLRMIEAAYTPIGGSAGGWIVPTSGNPVDAADVTAILDQMGFVEGLHYRILTTDHLDYGKSAYTKRLKRIMIFDDQSFIFAKMVLG